MKVFRHPRNLIVFALALLGFAWPITASAGSVPGQLSHLCNLKENPVKPSDNKIFGIYDGKWDNKLPHTVIIYQSSSNKVKIYYAYGTYGPWNILKAECIRRSAKIKSDGSVKVGRFGNGAEVVYRLDDDGITLHGTYTRNGAKTPGTFVRVE